MITHLTGDAVKALQNDDIDFLLHCCNNRGVMASGIAKQIRDTFPEAYEVYKKYHDYFEGNGTLGTVTTANGVVNIVGQNSFGYDGKRYLHYGHLAHGLIEFKRMIEHYDYSVRIGFPYLFGCDRAGGDWNVVEELIEGLLGTHNVFIYKLP